MNLLLLLPDDGLDSTGRVRLRGRRLRHVLDVHRASVGDELRVGLMGGGIGVGRVLHLTPEVLELEVRLDHAPPLPLPLTLILVLPRPKVLRRVLRTASSMGVKRIILLNARRVEKSYWQSPYLEAHAMNEQLLLGLEQARDTLLPEILTRPLFKPFVEDELPAIIKGTLPLVAHPTALGGMPPKHRPAGDPGHRPGGRIHPVRGGKTRRLRLYADSPRRADPEHGDGGPCIAGPVALEKLGDLPCSTAVAGGRIEGLHHHQRSLHHVDTTSIGVLGGSGLYRMKGLTDQASVALTTPFGKPSDEIVVGTLAGKRVAFLPRHGRGHRLLPSEIPYLANIHALRQLGVRHLISVSAVGSMREAIAPGHLCLPDQFIDLTQGRPRTFFGDGIVGHMPFNKPVCADLAAVLHARREGGRRRHAQRAAPTSASRDRSSRRSPSPGSIAPGASTSSA